jgi:beta-phosphoglucomutase
MSAAAAGVEALVFDFNGTLSDDEPLMYEIYRRLFAEQGRPVSRAQYFSELAGHSEEAIIGGWLGVQDEELEALVAERIARYNAAAVDGSTVPERVREAVRHASKRLPIAVVSGAFRSEVETVLRAAGIADCFRFLVTADDVERGKPAPDGYAEALVRLGNPSPETVAAIEDTEAGVASAKAAGLHTVAILGTHPRERLTRADEIAERLDLDLVRRLLSRGELPPARG